MAHHQKETLPTMQSIDDIGAYTLPRILRNTVGKFPDMPALSVVGKTPLTYMAFQKEIQRYASLLIDTGVKQGDRVALFAPSSPKWGVAYFAIVCLGAIAVPMLPDFNKAEAEGIIRHSEALFAFVSESNADKLVDCDAALSSVFVLENEQWLRGEPEGTRTSPEAVDLFKVPVEEDDTASIIYTSGTTGTPKGVELSHRNIAFMATQVRLIQDIYPGDVFLSILPMSHVYEFTIGFIFPVMQGCHVSYLGRAVAVSSLLPALQTVKPNIMLSVPAVMEKIYKNRIVPTFQRNKFIAALYRMPTFRRLLHKVAGRKLMHTFGGNIRFFGLGGAKTQPDTERFLKEGGFPYAIGYGLTETSPLVAGANPNHTKLESTGPKLEGTEMKLIDVNPETGVGEIVTKGPHVMKGYYRNEELTRSVFTEDGFFKTGDNGYIDEDGYLFIKGRSKNVIIGPSGENIYPEDIEFVLNKHPLVMESLVVERDNRLVALVKLDESLIRTKEEGTSSEGLPKEAGEDSQAGILADIRTYVNTQVNKFSQLKAIEHIADLEKTASQKIKRFLYNAGGKGRLTEEETEARGEAEKTGPEKQETDKE